METLYKIKLTGTQINRLACLIYNKVEQVAEGDYEIYDDVSQAEEQDFWHSIANEVDKAINNGI